MCGRFVLAHSEDEVAQEFKIKNRVEYKKSYNIPPSSQILAMKHPGEACLLKWGLVPVWAEDQSIGSKLINARAETIDKKPSFKNAFKRRRCLIIASGFYEWRKEEKRKQPHFILMKDKKPFAMAGIWDHWESPKEESFESCAIITTTPNSLMAPIHQRMPVIIEPDNYDKWLDPDRKQLKPFLKPFDSQKMLAYPVSIYVNRPKNNDRGCILPLRSPTKRPNTNWHGSEFTHSEQIV